MALFGIFGKKQNDKTSQVNTKNIELEMHKNNTMGYRDKKDNRVYQNALLEKINSAKKKYENDHDLNAVIEVFEDAFIKSDPPCISSQNLDLVDFYLKNNQNDKAWGYLNLLYSKQQAPAEKIRSLQANILKKEKKYDQAIDFYIMKHLEKSEFAKESFILDIKPCLTKLKLDISIGDQIASIIQKCIAENNFDDRKIIDLCRTIYKKEHL